MKQYLWLGDTHGDWDFVERAALLAAENDAEIIQLGDFGFVWPVLNRTTMKVTDRAAQQVQTLSTSLARAGEYCARSPITMRFIDGNHDWHPKLQAILQDGPWMDGSNGGVWLAPNVVYQPRGSTYTDEDGTTFLFCGGAPSIDWQGRTPGVSWWPEEVISEEEFERAMAVDIPVHVLVTHDAPDFPPGYGPKGDPEFRKRGDRWMAMIRALVHKHEPELLVHGHWHTRYTSKLWGTRIEGLNCNFASLADATMLWSRDP